MNQLEPDFPLEMAPMSHPTQPSLPTAEQVLAAIDADRNIATSRRRDMRSAVHRLCKLEGYEGRPSDFVIRPTDVTKAMAGITAEQLGVSDKRLRNLRHDLKTVLKRYVQSPTLTVSKTPLSPAWVLLRTKCQDDHNLYFGLLRFMRYCSSLGLEPEDVSNSTLAEYMDWVEASVVLKDPLKIQRQTRNAWNRAVDRIPVWPRQKLDNPRKPNTYVLKWRAFRASFQKDAGGWLALLQSDDPFNEDAPTRPLKPASIQTRDFQIRQIASAMVKHGRPLDDLQHLDDLLDPDWIQKALDFISTRTTTGPSHQKSQLLYVLQTIAKHWVHADNGLIRSLARARRSQSPKLNSMTSKNRVRLAQLQDETNLINLVCLPERLLWQVKNRKVKGQKATHALEAALLLEILLMFPLRLKNLAGLKLGSQVQIIGAGNEKRAQIMVPEDEVKNGMPLLATLPPESMVIFDAYMELARPLLSGSANDWLFPGPQARAHKNKTTIGRRIKNTVKVWTGLDLNTHAFRHVDTLIYLTDRPGHYEDVRRILAHTTTATVEKYYADLEVQPAVDRLHDSVLNLRKLKVG